MNALRNPSSINYRRSIDVILLRLRNEVLRRFSVSGVSCLRSRFVKIIHFLRPLSLISLFVFSAVSKTEDSRDYTSDNTHFNLWTRSNPILLQEIINGNSLSLSSSNFDASKPTKIFAHGWLMNGYNNPTVLAMRDGMLLNIF